MESRSTGIAECLLKYADLTFSCTEFNCRQWPLMADFTQ